eukprot:8088991-Alexandrium_andersonii.AAC.1
MCIRDRPAPQHPRHHRPARPRSSPRPRSATRAAAPEATTGPRAVAWHLPDASPPVPAALPPQK